jgi:hypothetical protein
VPFSAKLALFPVTFNANIARPARIEQVNKASLPTTTCGVP